MSQQPYDPRRGGGDEYAQPQRAAPQSRPAPQGYDPAQAHANAHEGWQPPPPAPPQASPYQPPHVQQPAPPPLQPAAAPSDEDDPSVVTLSRAYIAHGEPVRKLRFRKPTAGDLARAGHPIRSIMDATGRVIAHDERPEVFVKYIQLLATPALPPSTIEQFEIDDYNACAGAILLFFLA